MTIKYTDIRMAFDFVSAGPRLANEAYLDKRTGKIYWQSAYGDNEEELPSDIGSGHYLPIPHKNEFGLGSRLAIAFAYQHLPQVADEVEAIFRRKGAYSKYKNLLERCGALKQWYEYEEEAQDKELKAWCEDNELETRG